MQVASSASDVVGFDVEGAVGLVGPVLAVGVTVAGVGGGHAATVATREVVLGVAARCGRNGLREDVFHSFFSRVFV